MKFLVIGILASFSGLAVAGIFPKGDSDYQCQTKGGFFDVSPNRAIAACRKEIDKFCKSKGAPAIIGKINGEPAGPARYARAEISFQCMTAEDVAVKQQKEVEIENQQISAEVQGSKKVCQQDFGFVPDTPEFSNCLLELQKQHFANRRAVQEVTAQKEIAEAQLSQQRQSDADRTTMNAIQSFNKTNTPPVRTNCVTLGSSVSCTSQ